jgi:hypothetical protein
MWRFLNCSRTIENSANRNSLLFHHLLLQNNFKMSSSSTPPNNKSSLPQSYQMPMSSSLTQISKTSSSMTRVSGIMREDSIHAPLSNTASTRRTHSRSSSKDVSGSYKKSSIDELQRSMNVPRTNSAGLGSGNDLERVGSDKQFRDDFNTLWPVISRSRSSYSIHVLQDYNNAISPIKSPKLPAGEGFLKDIESNGFSGMWNHPITRCYFLMYLIWSKQANLYVCIYALMS